MQPPIPGQPVQGQRGAAPKGIDPDMVPNPVAVNADDVKRMEGASYVTSSRLNPPLTGTNSHIIDDGNCSPRVIRSSMYNVPAEGTMLDTSGIPLAIVVQPLGDAMGGRLPVPIVDHGPDGPIRCRRCKAYINPGVVFVDGGRNFICNFCGTQNEVQGSYFCNLDHTGRRNDIESRPELRSGTVEYKATAQYHARPPVPISYLFVIDVSYASVKSGLVASAAQAIHSILDSLPIDATNGMTTSSASIGIITYDSAVQFYNLSAGLSQPQMMVVTDTKDPFVPLKSGLLVNAHNSHDVIVNLLSQLPHMFEHNVDSSPQLGAAVRSGIEAMKDAGGKLMVFASTLPTTGPGNLKARDDSKLYGTDKEKSLLTPADTFYDTESKVCVKHGICVDFFLCHHAFIDVATIGTLSHRTGGTVNRFRGFQAHLHGEHLVSTVRRAITRTHGFDAMMRVRASSGLRPVDFFGAFTMDNTTEIELAGIDEDKAIVVQCKHDDKLSEQKGTCFQVALLYTSVHGERIIRVSTLCLNVVSQLADVYRGADMEAVLAMVVKSAIRDARRVSLGELRGQLKAKCSSVLGAYRKHCTSPDTSAGQLILPECLKLMPCYVSSAIKHTALRAGADTGPDDRMDAIFLLLRVGCAQLVASVYPRVVQVDDIEGAETGVIPPIIRPSYARFQAHAAYFVEDGSNIYLWIGSKVSPIFVQKVLGAPSFQAIDGTQTKLQALDNEVSAKVRALLGKLQDERSGSMGLVVVKQKDPSEALFSRYLVEDAMRDALSYVDFLCNCHREIQNLSK